MIHTLIRSAVLLAAATALSPLEAQTTAPSVTLAGSGYRLPNLPRDVAPGQLLLISLRGIKTSIPGPHLAAATSR